jgi:hypothetical protein
MDNLKFQGRFKLQHIRNGKVLKEHDFPNGVTTVGLNDLLDSAFANGTQRTWYVGIINDAVIGDLAAADTMASHAGWSEDSNYTEAARPAWITGDTAASKSLVNAAFVVFTINATTTVSGIFITSVTTKGGATGILWSTAIFVDGNIAAESSDVLNVVYTLTAA